MTIASDRSGWGEGRDVGVSRWLVAGAAVLAAHAVAGWLALHLQPAFVPPGGAPPAVIIDLAPLAVAPAAPALDVAPGPEMTEAQPEPQPDMAFKPEDMPAPAPPEPLDAALTPTVVPPPEPVAEPPKADVPPEPVVEPPPKPPEVVVPKIEAPLVTAEAVLPPPPVARPQIVPKPPRPVVRKPEPKPPVARKPAPKPPVERKPPVNAERPPAPRTSAPPSSAAPRGPIAGPAPVAAPAPGVSAASWRGAMVAHLNRYKRFPPGAASTGTAMVAFTISRSGAVLGARLVSSSGNPMLDAEAVALPRRASPMPAPPPSVAGATIALTVPVRFSR